MNIQQLEYIIAVDQFKSFSLAAAHCYITQGGLNAMVKKLEVELGTVLFDRRSKIVITTAAGIELIKEAKEILQHTKLLIDKAKKINNSIAGPIRVGLIPTLAFSLLPKIKEQLYKSFPDLNLEIFSLSSDVIIRQVKEGQLDMGIAVVPELPVEVGKVMLFKEALMAYGDGFNASEEVVTINENLTAESANVDLLLDTVDQLGGSTLITELCYQMLSDERKERVISFDSPAPVREINLVFHKKYTNGKIVQAIADLIRSSVNHTLRAEHFLLEELEMLD